MCVSLCLRIQYRSATLLLSAIDIVHRTVKYRIPQYVSVHLVVAREADDLATYGLEQRIPHRPGNKKTIL